MAWRRSYDTPPPPIERGSKFSQDADPRYANIGGGPLTECLADVVARFLPYFTDVIVPDLRTGKTVLIAAHGNSLRALVKYLDQMSDDEVVGLNIPTGIPLRYDLDARSAARGAGRYLPRPGSGRCGCRRGSQPGSRVSAPPGAQAAAKAAKSPVCQTSREQQRNTCSAECDLSDFGLAPLGRRSPDL